MASRTVLPFLFHPLDLFGSKAAETVLNCTVISFCRTVFLSDRAVFSLNRAVAFVTARLFHSTVRLFHSTARFFCLTVRFFGPTVRLRSQPHGFSVRPHGFFILPCPVSACSHTSRAPPHTYATLGLGASAPFQPILNTQHLILKH